MAQFNNPPGTSEIHADGLCVGRMASPQLAQTVCNLLNYRNPSTYVEPLDLTDGGIPFNQQQTNLFNG